MWTHVWGPVANQITSIPHSPPIESLWVVSAPVNYWPCIPSIMNLKSKACHVVPVQVCAAGLYQYVCPLPPSRDVLYEKCHMVQVLLCCQIPDPLALSIIAAPRMQTHDQGYIRDVMKTVQLCVQMLKDAHVPSQQLDDSCPHEDFSACLCLHILFMRIGHVSCDDVRIPSECGWRS